MLDDEWFPGINPDLSTHIKYRFLLNTLQEYHFTGTPVNM